MQSMSFKKMQSAFFFGLILLLGFAVLYLLRPFAFPIFWAAVVAVMFHPMYRWVNSHIKIPTASAGISLVIVTVVLFLPLMLLSLLLAGESVSLYETVVSEEFLSSAEAVATRLETTWLGPVFEWIRTKSTDLAPAAAASVSVFIFENIRSITQNSLRFVFMSFIMLYSLYYFFKDGPRMLGRLMHLSPLGDKYEAMLYQRFTSTTRATLKTTVIIGGIQGILGAILFWVTGIESVLIWGVLMTILSIIPAIGSFLIWMPAGIIMLAFGNVWEGVTILLFGSIVISNIDNLLRPPLIGRDIQMHPLLVLFSTLGGIALFGVSGFIIGPILMALFLAVMSMYDHYYKHELLEN